MVGDALAVVADVAVIIPVTVLLVRVGKEIAVVILVGDAVIVLVRIAVIPQGVTIGVKLLRIVDVRAVVGGVVYTVFIVVDIAGGTDSIEITVLLAGIGL